MKTKLTKKAKKLASALLTVLMLTGILSWFVMSYLSLLEQQNMLSYRSQSWNVAMGIVESGIEEGMEQLNSNITNLTGWSSDSTGFIYSRSNTLADGSSYSVFLNLSNTYLPVVTATAHVNLPTFAQANPRSSLTMFAAGGVTTGGGYGPGVVSRAVQVTCFKGNLFTTAIVAKHNINLNGNGVYTDSYDSSLPGIESDAFGQYNSSIFSGDRGDVATDGGITSLVGVQNGNIYGKVHTGPNCPVSVGPNGAVGSHQWQASNSGFEPGWVAQDANFTFPDTTAPTGPFLPPPASYVVTNSITYSFTTNAVSTNVCPNPMPASGVQTNALLSTVNTLPNPLPSGAVVTNSYVTNSASLPSPIPAGIITNFGTVSITASSVPAPGTYIGGVVTSKSHGRTQYTYNLITSTSYTYSVLSYTYTSFQYTYDNTITNVLSMNTTTYDHVLFAGVTNHVVASANLTGNNLVVGSASSPGQSAVLILDGGLTGNENWTFTGGASLLIYSGGTSVAVAGNTIVNPGGYAGNFQVLCSTNVTSVAVSGNGQITTILVAPAAMVSLNGGGNNNIDFCGSLMCDSITFNGHYRFHYDEALSKGPTNGRYLITSWNEVNPNGH